MQFSELIYCVGRVLLFVTTVCTTLYGEENSCSSEAAPHILVIQNEANFLKLDNDPNITTIYFDTRWRYDEKQKTWNMMSDVLDKDWVEKIVGRKYSANIREIQFAPSLGMEILPEALEPLQELPNLTNITISHLIKKSLNKEHLKFLAKIPQLRYFYCFTVVEADAWEFFAQFAQLDTLSISGRGDHALTSDFAPPRLKTLQIKCFDESDLPRILACKSLESIDLGFPNGFSMKDLQQFCSLKKLRSLKLSGELLNPDHSVSREAFQALFSRMPQLQGIQTEFQLVSPQGWSYTDENGNLCTQSYFRFIFSREKPPMEVK